MMDWFQSVDIYFFRQINQVLVNSFFDLLMPIIRHKNTWIGLYVLMGIFLIRKHQTKSVVLILWMMVFFFLSDLLSGQIFKDLIMRLRPCNDPSMVGLFRLLIRCSQGYSFPSAHASNHMLIALMFSYIAFHSGNRYWPIILYPWALLIGYAQVYVGVHYPSDILGGYLISFLLFIIFKLLLERLPFLKNLKWKESQIFEKK